MRLTASHQLTNQVQAADQRAIESVALLQRGILLTVALSALGIVCTADVDSLEFTYRLYLLGCYVYLLYMAFAGPLAGCISGLHKAFLAVLTAGPFSLLTAQFITGRRPWLIYPHDLRLGAEGPGIEIMSYAMVACFLGLTLAFTRFRHNPETLASRPPADSGLVFYFLLVQSLLYATLSFGTDNCAFLEGGYAKSAEGPVGGINAWGAMATFALLLSFGYCRRDKAFQKACFWAAVLYVVLFANLLYGKRADVIGLSLVVLAIVTRRRMRGKRFVRVLILCAATVGVGVLVGASRTEGINSSTAANLYLVKAHSTDGGCYIPNITESYSSLPLVISYREFDGGSIWLGRTYFNAATTLLPEAVNPYRIRESATTYLQANYHSFPGGMYFPGELWFNFGKWGMLAAAPLVAWLLNWFAHRFWYTDRQELLVIAFAIMTAFPRWLLYGSSAFTKSLFLLALFAVGIHFVASLQFQAKRSYVTH